MDIRSELKYKLQLQNQQTENAIVVKIIECDEIVGHIPEFHEQILASMMWSGNISSIDLVSLGEPRNAPKVTWVFGGGIEIPCIYQIYGCKKKKQNIWTAIRNATFPKKGLCLGGVISEGA